LPSADGIHGVSSSAHCQIKTGTGLNQRFFGCQPLGVYVAGSESWVGITSRCTLNHRGGFRNIILEQVLVDMIKTKLITGNCSVD
jgi:hypothetical protein